MKTLGDLNGTKWAGSAELWLDPLGDQASRSDCTVTVAGDGVVYTWSHEGQSHEGRITLRGESAEYSDSWHHPAAMKCERLRGAAGLFQVQGCYGPDQDWGWRIGLFHRAPTDELVLQMTNIAPWGEEARAVRMVCKSR